jgi:hypothetical protein
MRHFNFSIVALLFFASCNGQTHSNSPSAFFDTTKQFKNEIPTYQNGGVDIFYKLAKAKQAQLGLDSIEKGFENLQIRVWYDFSLVRERKLVVITNKDTNWTATVYNLQVNWDGNTETILSKKVRRVMPKSGWISFSKKLLDLKILTLPNQNDIKDYGSGFDGRTYNVEIATKMQYRFYGYWEPQEYQNKFWQAKNMADILKLFETELGI